MSSYTEINVLVRIKGKAWARTFMVSRVPVHGDVFTLGTDMFVFSVGAVSFRYEEAENEILRQYPEQVDVMLLVPGEDPDPSEDVLRRWGFVPLKSRKGNDR